MTVENIGPRDLVITDDLLLLYERKSYVKYSRAHTTFGIACRQEIFLIWNVEPARDFVQLIHSPTSNSVITESALTAITSHYLWATEVSHHDVGIILSLSDKFWSSPDNGTGLINAS